MSSTAVPSKSETEPSNVNERELSHNSDAKDVSDANGVANGTATEASQPSANNKSPQEENGHSSNEEFEDVNDSILNDCTFMKVLEKFQVCHYDASKETVDESLINRKCRLLFLEDYKIEMVKNDSTANYPKEIIIPVGKNNEKNCVDFDAEAYYKLVKECQTARLRSRFAVPTILFDNKFICRSGTTGVWLSVIYEMIKQALFSGNILTSIITNPISSIEEVFNTAYDWTHKITSYSYLKDMFVKDASILEYLEVGRICDLMVEHNKHYRALVNVSSSEKVNEEIYKQKNESIPYPGCEFFTKYSSVGRVPEGLLFDWDQEDVTRTLELTEDSKQFFGDMNIENYKEWDLVRLTQNYMKIILTFLVTGTEGMALHCISGWDRTPLFISLIRLSLWADGVIHENLNREEIAYLTVAYDWFLFGHNLPDRLNKDEEVMHFCFNFLKYITSDDFSVTRIFKELPPEMKKDRTFPEFMPGRREVLNDIRNYVLESYDVCIIKSI